MIADDFLTKFKDSPIPLRAPTPEIDQNAQIYSCSIMFPYGCILIPYSIYQTFIENPLMDFDEEFSQDLTWLELLGIISQKQSRQRKKLTKTAVLICKVLSRYGIKNQQFKFPITVDMIGNRTRLSLSIVKETFTSVYLRGIASDFFLLNPWKLGWELYLISYPTTSEELFKEYSKESISFETCSNGTMFRVLQIPMVKETSLVEILQKKLHEANGNLHAIQKTHFNWDISQLEPKSNKSFLNIPNFYSKSVEERIPDISFMYDDNPMDWFSSTSINQDKSLEKKLKFNENSKKAPLSFTELKKERIFLILNYLIEFGVPLKNYERTAEKIGLPVEEFSVILRFLINKEVIVLAHRFNYIGASREYSFLIENGSEKVNKMIKQSLLKSVFSYFYEGNNFIAGRVQLPDLWVDNFIEYLARLQYKFKELHISYGARLIGYHFF